VPSNVTTRKASDVKSARTLPQADKTF